VLGARNAAWNGNVSHFALSQSQKLIFLTEIASKKQEFASKISIFPGGDNPRPDPQCGKALMQARPFHAGPHGSAP